MYEEGHTLVLAFAQCTGELEVVVKMTQQACHRSPAAHACAQPLARPPAVTRTGSRSHPSPLPLIPDLPGIQRHGRHPRRGAQRHPQAGDGAAFQAGDPKTRAPRQLSHLPPGLAPRAGGPHAGQRAARRRHRDLLRHRAVRVVLSAAVALLRAPRGSCAAPSAPLPARARAEGVCRACRAPVEADAQSLRAEVLLDELEYRPGVPDTRTGHIIVCLLYTSPSPRDS